MVAVGCIADIDPIRAQQSGGIAEAPGEMTEFRFPLGTRPGRSHSRKASSRVLLTEGMSVITSAKIAKMRSAALIGR